MKPELRNSLTRTEPVENRRSEEWDVRPNYHPRSAITCGDCAAVTTRPHAVRNGWHKSLVRRGVWLCPVHGKAESGKQKAEMGMKPKPKHAMVQREGFMVPLIGIPPDAVLEECDCCHELLGLEALTWTGKQMLCAKCATP